MPSEPVVHDSYRMFLCALCRKQTRICRSCDRGHRYCSTECSQKARQASVTAARIQYRQTDKGKKKHAERQRAYRARKKQRPPETVPTSGKGNANPVAEPATQPATPLPPASHSKQPAAGIRRQQQRLRETVPNGKGNANPVAEPATPPPPAPHPKKPATGVCRPHVSKYMRCHFCGARCRPFARRESFTIRHRKRRRDRGSRIFPCMRT